jgi:hypothetical protein
LYHLDPGRATLLIFRAITRTLFKRKKLKKVYKMGAAACCLRRPKPFLKKGFWTPKNFLLGRMVELWGKVAKKTKEE